MQEENEVLNLKISDLNQARQCAILTKRNTVIVKRNHSSSPGKISKGTHNSTTVGFGLNLHK